ncbi:hypothetical protein [Nocardia sp. NBC_01327]|uniref:hypothetical protein n=1 Tax=Nocardia sp. NBC_01327 TaxID=2903593 RepID=UPI002E13420C|nr:hypothetical protein OG326_14175 [Nocardia sp. NBC_01327]
MGDMLRADVEALRVMAAAVRVEAETIAGIDPVDVLAKVGRAMPNSAIGAAVAGVGEPLRFAFAGMAERLVELAEVSEHGARGYAEIDAAFEGRLDSYLQGRP